MHAVWCISIVLLLAITTIATQTEQVSFTGTWLLDRANSESPYALLTAIGMASSKRGIASRLDITEIYSQTPTSISVHRITSYTDDMETHQFGISTQKDDSLLGQGTQLTTLKNGKIIYHFVRHNGAVYHSVKEISLEDTNKMTVSMSFTESGSNKPVSCVRIFRRISTSTTN